MATKTITKQGLNIKRKFTTPEVNPFDTVEYQKCSSKITEPDGSIVFEMNNIEAPKSWSQLAIDIAASKYFKRAQVPTPEGRETSIKQMIIRVSKTIRNFGEEQNYFTKEGAQSFEDELNYILLHQIGAFNSPVWFNCGLFHEYGIKGSKPGTFFYNLEKNEVQECKDPYSYPQCSACQPYHALINTTKGLIPIGKIVEENMINTEVFDGNSTTKIVAVKHNGKKQVYRIKLRDGSFIDATGDHVICAHNERRTRKFEWKKVEEVKLGDYMRIYTNAVPKDNIINPKKEAEAALAGWLQTDGFVGQYTKGKNRSLTIEFITVNDDEFNWINSNLNIIFPDVHKKIRNVDSQNQNLKIKRIRIYGEVLRSFVEKYGLLKRKLDIRVPQVIWSSSQRVILTYLKSVFQAEGYSSTRKNSGRIGLAMISKEFVEDIRTLLLKIGIYSRLRQKKEKRTNREDTYAVDISIGSEKKKFIEYVGFIAKNKITKSQQLLLLKNQKECPLIQYSQIVAIETLDIQDVYDIQTESGHYLTNSVLVHNCFIQKIEDSLDSIYQLITNESRLFKFGSGTGTNFSALRGPGEKLSGGGISSGLMSYLKILDRSAAAVKSGGITRRAAKMCVLDMDHPEIEDYILWKVKEEEKVQALIAAGYPSDFNGEAYLTVSGQNSNNSIMIPDKFMTSVLEDQEWDTTERTTGNVVKTYKARDLMRTVSKAAWRCADPGVMFYDTMNKWNVCADTEHIHSTNPCVTGDTKVLTKEGKWMRIDKLLNKETTIITNTGIIEEQNITGSFKTGIKPVYSLKTKSGYELKLTADHKVFTANRGFIEAMNLTKDDLVLLPFEAVSEIQECENKEFFQLLGVYLGDGCGSQTRKALTLTMSPEERPILETLSTHIIENYERKTHKTTPATVQIAKTTHVLNITNHSVVESINQYVDIKLKSHEKVLGDQIFELPLSEQKYVLQGLFTTDGTVANYGDKSQYVALDSASLKLLKDVQILLSGFGIKSKIYNDRRAGKNTSLLPDGKGGIKEYKIKPAHSIRISRSSRILFENLIGFMPGTKKAEKLSNLNQNTATYKDTPFDYVKSLDYIGKEQVYDLTEPITHTFIANGITIHNCAEFVFLDGTACNLASINLMKLMENNTFNIEKYRHVCRIFIIAQEIIVDMASYPTEMIAKRSHELRPLGLGYANLGTLLMTNGIVYDSDKGRAIAGAISAITTGHSYRVSAEIADSKKPFPDYEKNKNSMMRVIKQHRDAAYQIDVRHCPSYLLEAAREDWDKAVEAGEISGYKNAQVTVIAPTGTIGLLMDCDTTGVEPEFSLIKWKKLAGGGYFKIINKSIGKALTHLNYTENQIKEIIDFTLENGNIENAPHLKEEHLPIFDCANKNEGGKRFIDPMGHVKIMAAVQPFISGAISKTVNLPKNATIEDIEKIYFQAWKLGLKCIALYRDGCKESQPLNTKLEQKTKITGLERGTEKKLSYKRNGITISSKINGNKVFMRTGEYEDKKIGEIFIDMHKAGSSYRSLMNCFAIAVSMGLKYGVPLEEYVDMFTFTRFEPSGLTTHPNVKSATSVIDFVFRVLGMEYLGRTDFVHVPPNESQEEQESTSEKNSEVQTRLPNENLSDKEKQLSDMLGDAPLCDLCGHTTVRNGSCYKCLNCGNSMGCS